MKMQWTLLVGLIFALIIAVFATVNGGRVPVNYVFGEAYWPLVLVILGSTLIGALISACFAALRIFKQSRQIATLNKQLHEKERLLADTVQAKHLETEPLMADQQDTNRSQL